MPEKDMLIFDGACGICTAVAQGMGLRDRDNRLAISPYQHADLEALGLTEEEASRAVQFVRTDGWRASGARATFEALRRLPGVWGVVGAVGALPPVSWLCEPFYRLVARHRAQISVWLGMTACAVPPAEETYE